MATIPYFVGGDDVTRNKLNAMVDVCNAMLNIRGDSNLSIRYVPGVSTTFSTRIPVSCSPPSNLLVPVFLDVDGSGAGGYPTYTLYRYPPVGQLQLLARKVPLKTARSIMGEQVGTVATHGLAYYNGNAANSGDAAGTGGNGIPPLYTGTGIVDGSGNPVFQPWELWWCDEQYATADGCGVPTGTGNSGGESNGSSGTITGTGG